MQYGALREKVAPVGRHYPPRVKAALEYAADCTGSLVSEILGGRRFARLVIARKIACARLLKLGYSLSETALYLNLHHSSVIYYRDHPSYSRLFVQRPKGGITLKLPTEPDLSGEWAI